MKVLNKVVGFVGAGNMASSLISGMIKAGLKPDNIIASSPGKTHLNVLSDKFGIKTSKDNKLVFNDSEIIIFAVKWANLAVAVTIAVAANRYYFYY